MDISKKYKGIQRCFVANDSLYAIKRDNTIWRLCADYEWEKIRARQIVCPHCKKKLEPHICEGENNDTN